MIITMGVDNIDVLHGSTATFDFFSVRSFFISLMDTKSGIFTRGFATHENTAFVVHSVK